MVRDGVKSIATLGVDVESRWPYDVALFTQEPPLVIMEEALTNKITTYSRLNKASEFKSCLAAGRPFVVGIKVYESFESDVVAKTGMVPVPTAHEQLLGGHCVCVIGYDSNKDGKFQYLVQNSWGSSWGDPENPGCFWIPAAYLESSKYSSDAWTLSK
jgi:C1A family cysteine protease